MMGRSQPNRASRDIHTRSKAVENHPGAEPVIWPLSFLRNLGSRGRSYGSERLVRQAKSLFLMVCKSVRKWQRLGRRAPWNGQELGVNRRLFWTLLLTLLLLVPAFRAEADDAVFRVTGVSVDATDRDAAAAKMKAISEAQVKAFGILVDRIAEEGADAKLKALPPGQI